MHTYTYTYTYTHNIYIYIYYRSIVLDKQCRRKQIDARAARCPPTETRQTSGAGNLENDELLNFRLR